MWNSILLLAVVIAVRAGTGVESTMLSSSTLSFHIGPCELDVDVEGLSLMFHMHNGIDMLKL
jgi:hypothetical protein